MSFLRKFITKIFWWLLKLILPKKYFNTIFISDFLHCEFLKKLTLKEKLWSFKRGFTPREFLAYNLKVNDHRNYLSSLSNYKKANLNGHYNNILGNKLLFGEFIKTIIKDIDSLGSIDNLAYIEKGNLFPLGTGKLSDKYSSLMTVLEKNELIIKPVYGHQGKGVFLISRIGDDYFLDNNKMTWEKLTDILKSLDNYLVQEKFIQTGISHDIYPGTLNTIRIATMMDPFTNKPFVGYAIHRFGSGLSGNRDNISQGGIGSFIDNTTGKLNKGMVLKPSGKIEVYEKHPLSGQQISEQQIPGWNDLLLSLVEMAARMPYLKYVGWDIIFSGNKLYVLEGNVCPGMDGTQMHKPLLQIEQVRKFFKYYNFI